MKQSFQNPLIRADLHGQEKPSLGIMGYIAKDEIVHPTLGLRTFPGGSAAAVATAAVQLGIKTSIFSKIGKDFPFDWLSVLDNLGVDISKVEISENNETLRVKIIYDENGETELIEFNEAVLENLDIKTLPRTDGVHLCPMKPREQKEYIKKLKGHCDILSISFSEYFINEYKEKDFFEESGLADVNILFASEKEAQAISKEDVPEKAAAKLHSKGLDVVAITLGKKGSLVYEGREMRRIGALDVPVVDTTGCWDSYIGGFLAEFLTSKDVQMAAGIGSYLASLTVQKKGAWAGLLSDVGVRF